MLHIINQLCAKLSTAWMSFQKRLEGPCIAQRSFIESLGQKTLEEHYSCLMSSELLVATKCLELHLKICQGSLRLVLLTIVNQILNGTILMRDRDSDH